MLLLCNDDLKIYSKTIMVLCFLSISARVVTDRVSGYSKGFGFVKYATLEDAARGIEGMDGKVRFIKPFGLPAPYTRRLKCISVGTLLSWICFGFFTDFTCVSSWWGFHRTLPNHNVTHGFRSCEREGRKQNTCVSHCGWTMPCDIPTTMSHKWDPHCMSL
jgi:hypothetical protein